MTYTKWVLAKILVFCKKENDAEFQLYKVHRNYWIKKKTIWKGS